jgi:hypothetical protein
MSGAPGSEAGNPAGTTAAGEGQRPVRAAREPGAALRVVTQVAAGANHHEQAARSAQPQQQRATGLRLIGLDRVADNDCIQINFRLYFVNNAAGMTHHQTLCASGQDLRFEMLKHFQTRVHRHDVHDHQVTCSRQADRQCLDFFTIVNRQGLSRQLHAIKGYKGDAIRGICTVLCKRGSQITYSLTPVSQASEQLARNDTVIW